MNIRLLSALLGMQQQPPAPVVVAVSEGAAYRLRELVEAPEPAPDCVVPPEWDRAAYAEPWPPTLHAPPRGRIVSQASGPNRKQRRARR